MKKGWWLAKALLVLLGTNSVRAQIDDTDTRNAALVSKVELMVTDEKLQKLTDSAERFAEIYSSDSFLDQLINAEQIRIEKIRTYNNTLLYEIPLGALTTISVPRVGIYRKDLFEVSFAGFEYASDWHLQKQLQRYFVECTFDYFIHADDKDLALLNDTEQAVAQVPDSQGASVVQPDFFEFAQRPLSLSLASLGKKELLSMLIRSLLVGRCINGLKGRYLVQDQAQQEPVPIFSLLERQVLVNLFFNSASTSTFSMINSFIKKQGMLSPVFSESMVFEATQAVSFLVFFITWFTRSVLTPQWVSYLHEHRVQLKKLLDSYRALTQIRLCPDGCQVTQLDGRQASEIREQQDVLKRAIKQIIIQGQTVPFITWVRLRHTKYTQLEFCSNMLLSLPTWYRFGKKAYQLYDTFVQQPVAGEAL